MNPSPCSWSRLVGSDLGRVYGGDSSESRHYLFALCPARPDGSVSRAAVSLDQRRARPYPAEGEWWLMLMVDDVAAHIR